MVGARLRVGVYRLLAGEDRDAHEVERGARQVRRRHRELLLAARPRRRPPPRPAAAAARRADVLEAVVDEGALARVGGADDVGVEPAAAHRVVELVEELGHACAHAMPVPCA